jgi:hypothetical protein
MLFVTLPMLNSVTLLPSIFPRLFIISVLISGENRRKCLAIIHDGSVTTVYKSLVHVVVSVPRTEAAGT